MPSQVRTTGLLDIDGDISNNIALLRIKIDSRQRIYPADLDLLKDTYNLYIQHTHQLYDEQYRAYANTNPRGSASRTVDSTTGIGMTNLPYTIEMDKADHEQMALDIFDLIIEFNDYAHTHFHEWDDTAF